MTTNHPCHWTGARTPRALGPAHDGPHDECQPCIDRHCRLCGVEHVTEQTCPACIGGVRADLAAIVHMTTAELGEQTTDASTAGGRLMAAQPIPGGDATVLRAGGSDGRNQTYEILHGIIRKGETRPAPWTDDEHAGDPEPPLQVLASWEDDWRHNFGHKGGPRATIASAAGYLGQQLHRAAQHHDAFDEFAAHIAKTRAALEQATGHGTGDQRGTACLHCGATLVRKARDRQSRHGCEGHELGHGAPTCSLPRTLGCCDRGGVDLDGDWRCPKCRRTYTADGYANAVRAAALVNATKLTALDLSARFGISVAVIRVWANRGYLRKRGRAEDGRTLYDVSDVEKRRAGASDVA